MAVPQKKCCPDGFLYIDSAGYYSDPFIGTHIVSNNSITTPTLTQVENRCASIDKRFFASGPVEASDCPCCPEGYSYDQNTGKCTNQSTSSSPSLSGSGSEVDPIPCTIVPCPDPPDPRECEDCDAHPAHVSFTFDPTTQNCVECGVTGEPTGLGGGADAFLPIQLMDPIINFKLNS